MLTDSMRLMAVLAKTGEIESGMQAYKIVQTWNQSSGERDYSHLFAVARALISLSPEAAVEILTSTKYNESELLKIFEILNNHQDNMDAIQRISKERTRRKNLELQQQYYNF